MFKSIQWTLQLWHAGLLAVVLAGFGVASYAGIERMRYNVIDSQLERSVQLLAAHVPVPPPFPDRRGRGGGGGPGGPGGGPGGGDQGPGGGGGPWGGGPGRGGPGGGPNGPNGPNGMGGFNMRDPALDQFGNGNEGSTYFIVWRFDGEQWDSSHPDFTVPAPPAEAAMLNWQGGPPPPADSTIHHRNDRAGYREAYLYSIWGDRFLVGVSTEQVQSELRHAALLLGVIGGGVLMLGLAGGWLLSRRALGPIRKITSVAQDISASNLSRRIDAAGTSSELGTLASVLNSTFSRLESAFAQQVRFTADASHELRTPLAVIHTHAQLALSRERSAEEYKKSLATCLRASTRMKALVDSLLLLASADAGALTLDPQRFDLRDIVEECITMVSPLADEKGVAVLLAGGADVPPVELTADVTRISQVIINLLTNAVRYNKDEGSVHVSVEVEGSQAVVKVSDTGPGISAEHQAHLFERFYRVDKARSRELGGSGLGLAICKNIIDAHHGTIEVVSPAGEGATFIVKLPLNPAPCEPGA